MTPMKPSYPSQCEAHRGRQWEVEAVIDTGFTGFLSAPSALATELGLPFLTNESAFLADGSLVRFSVHDATALWDGQAKARLYPSFRHHASHRYADAQTTMT